MQELKDLIFNITTSLPDWWGVRLAADKQGVILVFTTNSVYAVGEQKTYLLELVEEFLPEDWEIGNSWEHYNQFQVRLGSPG